MLTILVSSFLSIGGASLMDNNFDSNAFEAICSEPILGRLSADCLVGEDGGAPIVDCPCCTRCCNRTRFSCVADQQKECLAAANSFVNEKGRWYNENRGTVCECQDGGYNLLCKDDCLSCNKDETICAENLSFGWKYSTTRPDFYVDNAKYRYVVGLNDTIDFRSRCASVYINGKACEHSDSGCYRQECLSNGFATYAPTAEFCQNIEGIRSFDVCDSTRNADEVDFGVMTLFHMQDPSTRSGCRPRIMYVDGDIF